MRIAIRSPHRPLVLWLSSPLLIVAAGIEVIFWVLVTVQWVTTPDAVMSSRFAALEVHGVSEHLAMTPLVLAVTVTPGVLGYGLWKEHRWARPLGTAYWLGAGLLIAAANRIAGLGWWPSLIPAGLGALASALAAWYFYRKVNVVDYYSQLREAQML